MRPVVISNLMRTLATVAALVVTPFLLPAQSQTQYPDYSQQAPQSTAESDASSSQDSQQPSAASHGGFRRVSDPAQSAQRQLPAQAQGGASQYPSQQQPSQRNQYPTYGTDQNEAQNQSQTSSPANQAPAYTIPSVLTIPAGTFITIRVNQTISTDRNQAGDAFTASLVRPIIVNGVIVAERGQTIGGRVSESQKAGRVEGTSRLGLQMTDLTLVDGQQVPIQSQFINRNGGTSYGRDAAGIGTSTALGAGIGAAAGGGFGAGVGAASGALVGVVGVLLTRGHPIIVYPESVLTFRIEAPVTINTERGAAAFRYVQNGDYDQPQDHQRPPTDYAYNGSTGYPVPPTPYGYGYPSPYYYGYGYPYYGTGFSFFYGPGFYGRGFYNRGFYGGGFYGGGFRGGFYGGGRGGRR